MQGIYIYTAVYVTLVLTFIRMGTLSQTLCQLGIKGDLVGQASAPNMPIPPSTSSLQNSSKRSSTAASTFSTDDDDKDSIISQKISDNEDDDYFPEETVNKRSSVHPGNSVWLDHSF
jgi:hypothetical protein